MILLGDFPREQEGVFVCFETFFFDHHRITQIPRHRHITTRSLLYNT